MPVAREACAFVTLPFEPVPGRGDLGLQVALQRIGRSAQLGALNIIEMLLVDSVQAGANFVQARGQVAVNRFDPGSIRNHRQLIHQRGDARNIG
jgi:hypothetical protein